MEGKGLIRCILLLLLCFFMLTWFAAAYTVGYVSGPVTDLKTQNPANYDKYQSLMVKADELMKKGNIVDAFYTYQDANKIVPKDSVSLASMGRAAQAGGIYTDAEDYFNQAETQAQLDNKYGDMSNKDYFTFMSSLTDERIRMAHNMLSMCTNEDCRSKMNQTINQYNQERKDWETKKAEEETGIGIPSPLFGVIFGLCSAAFIVWRRRAI